jgi:hypothetical protein
MHTVGIILGISMGFLPRLHELCPINMKVLALVELDDAIILVYLHCGKYIGIHDCQKLTFHTFLRVKSHG